MTLNPKHNAQAPAYRDVVMVGRAKTPAPLFGQRLASLRKQRGLTQLQFAEQLGISDKLVEYYERRAKNPSMELIKRVADFFEVSASYFVADEVQAPRKPGPRSEIDKRVAEIKQLPPKQQRLVLIMLDSFLAQARQA